MPARTTKFDVRVMMPEGVKKARKSEEFGG
jgi:hypothetical protein